MQRFRNILVVIERESRHEAAFARALWLARANGARLTFLDLAGDSAGELARLLQALPLASGGAAGDAAAGLHAERAEAFAGRARAEGVEAQAAVETGPPFLAVIRRVLRDGHDLVLKGQHTGASGVVAGFRGPDLHLMRKCPCPVWIVKDEVAGGSRRILACVDPDSDPGDETRAGLNRTVLELAVSLAERDGASVDILGVWRLEAEGILRSGRFELVPGEVDRLIERERKASLARLEALVAPFADRPVRLNILHLKGIPGDAIPDHAAQAGIDTVVMGTVGRIGIAGIFVGNTAETVLTRVRCAVLTVKPPGFASPVTLEPA
jgi:nucleotide-binding universal stress UspA family protein